MSKAPLFPRAAWIWRLSRKSAGSDCQIQTALVTAPLLNLSLKNTDCTSFVTSLSDNGDLAEGGTAVGGHYKFKIPFGYPFGHTKNSVEVLSNNYLNTGMNAVTEGTNWLATHTNHAAFDGDGHTTSFIAKQDVSNVNNVNLQDENTAQGGTVHGSYKFKIPYGYPNVDVKKNVETLNDNYLQTGQHAVQEGANWLARNVHSADGITHHHVNAGKATSFVDTDTATSDSAVAEGGTSAGHYKFKIPFGYPLTTKGAVDVLPGGDSYLQTGRNAVNEGIDYFAKNTNAISNITKGKAAAATAFVATRT